MATGLYGIEVPEGYSVRFRDFWSKSYLVDYLFLLFTAVVAFPVWLWVHPYNSWFSMTDPSISYPARASLIPDSYVQIVIFAPPLLLLFLIQIYFRNLHDLHSALLGFIEVIALCALFHAFIWISLAQPRPNFLAKCQPIADGQCTDPGRHDLIDARHGFPSGHAAFVTASSFYVAFYCWAKWESWRGSAFFPMQVLIWGYILAGIAIGCTRVSGGQHSSWGVIAGILIGAGFAFIGYHMHYPPFWQARAGIPYLRTWSLKQLWHPRANRLVTPRFKDLQ